MKRIAICAPSTPITRELAQHVLDLAAEFPALELHFHEQCFAEEGHFAGSDALRLEALLECANDPAFSAVWFAKGGYGANRIAGDALSKMSECAADKTYLGYSDAGYLLGALYRNKVGRPVHGPMPLDLKRADGEGAIRRALAFLSGDEPERDLSLAQRPVVAFNLMTLAMLCGTELMPDLTGHVVMVEEVSEHLYAVDRLFFHISEHLRAVSGLRMGRVSAVPENDRPFGAKPEEIARFWCARSGIPYLGRANIGHDADNMIVPFGLAGSHRLP